MRKLVFLFSLLLFVLVSEAADVKFTASAPNAIVMGEQFRLSFTVNAEAKDLRVQEMPDFEVLMGPSQSKSYSSSWVNGQSTSETTITYTYILMPKKVGTFNIAPATIKVNGANYVSNALSIKVLPPDKAAAGSGNSSSEGASSSQPSSQAITSDGLFVKMLVDDRNVYEQQGFVVTFKLYSLYDCGLTGVKFPEFEGFLAQEVELPEQKQWGLENYNGRNYRTVVLKQTVLYPQRSGKLTIPAGKFDAVVRVRTQQKVRSIFDDFFDSYQDVKKVITSSPASVTVKPLPAGKPASFSGAVGNFTMNASINSDRVKANEAVTIKLKLTGNGNVKLIKNPEVVFPNDFEIYDPKVETDIKITAAGVSGSKTIEYYAIPRYAGDFEIPAIEFSYFDTKSLSYKTLKAGPYKLHVEKGDGNAASPVINNFGEKESLKYIGQDIRYLKINDVRFVSKDDVFFGSFIYVLCYLIPSILFVVFFFIYRKQVKENANIALVRTKKANKMAVKRLKNAGKLLKANDKEAFYEEVLRALWGYLSDKLNIPQSNLTKDNVEAELIKYGVDESLINEFMRILNTCEFARYAPAQSSDAMDNLYELTADAIGKMENTIKK